MWICRLYHTDCLISIYDKSKLIAQIQSDEAKAILVCQTCNDYQQREGFA